jgi:hypothetical protein
MSTTILTMPPLAEGTRRPRTMSVADTALTLSARFWFLVAVLGQWLFVTYVVVFYGGAALRGNFAAWNKVLPHGYVPGATMSNMAVAAHLLLAVVIMVGGPLQLIPQLRSLAPSFHRVNGRLYMLAVVMTSIAGLYMVWSRGRSSVVQSLGISLDAVLIMTFAILALRYAMAREISTHRRWALRLFMVVNAGWFFRIGLMEWIVLNRGPVGFSPKTFTGPFLNFLSFADYLLPLAILEIYLRTRDRGGVSGRFAMAVALVVLTLGMGVGIFAAATFMWLPRL